MCGQARDNTKRAIFLVTSPPMAVTSRWAVSENLAVVPHQMRKAVVCLEGAAPVFIGPQLARFPFAPAPPVHSFAL